MTELRPPFLGLSIEEVFQYWSIEDWHQTRPEDSPYFAPVKQSPPTGEVPTILHVAEISPNWSCSDKISCNSCNTVNKFNSGGYVGLYSDGWLYVVGPNCGSETNQSNVREGQKAYDKVLRRRASDQVIRNVEDNYDEWRAEFILALDSIKFINNFKGTLRTVNSSLYECLLSATTYGDNNLVATVGKVNNAQIHSIRCGMLFSNKQPSSNEIIELTKATALKFGFSYKNESFDAKIDDENAPELSKAISEMNRFVRERTKISEVILANLKMDVQGINRWASYPRATYGAFGNAFLIQENILFVYADGDYRHYYDSNANWVKLCSLP